MLKIEDITYRIGGRALIENAGAFVPAGHRVGLVGHNGAGKSTLLRLILGDIALDDGDITLERGAKIATVAQEAPSGDLTPLDVVLAGDAELHALTKAAETETDGIKLAEIHERLVTLGAHSGPARAGRILAGLGFDDTAQIRPMSSFSGGWRMRVALAAVLFAEPDLLLLDEPTNYLDLEGTLWLETFLTRYPRTLIVVSHDRDLLNKAVNAILHLEGGKLTLYSGGFDRFMRTRTERIAHLGAERQRQDTRRKHLQSFVDRFRAKATKAKQAQARLKMIEKMEPLPELPGERRVSFTFKAGPELAPPIVQLDKAAVGYTPGKPVLRNLDLRIDPDDRIALLGSNGNGKSTFAKLLAGRLSTESGGIHRAPKLAIAFFTQHQADEFRPKENPIEHLQTLWPKASPTALRGHVGAFGLGDTLAETPTERLSGGEKARLLFALMASGRPNLMILDEPTNHLDIQAREALIQAINDFEGAVILISHDRHLIEACADRLWLVARGTARAFEGDLEDYRKIVLDGTLDGSKPTRSESAPGDSIDRKAQRREAAQARAAKAPLANKIRVIEKRLDAITKSLAAISDSLATPKIYNDPAEVVKLGKRRAELEREKESAETSWLSLQEGLGTTD